MNKINNNRLLSIVVIFLMITTCIVLVTQIPTVHALSSADAIMQWKMNVNNGTDHDTDSVAGKIGNAYDTTSWYTGKLGNCMYFDGTNDHIQCASTSYGNMNSDDDFSLECWIYSTANNSYAGLVGKGDWTVSAYQIQRHSDGTIKFWFGQGAGNHNIMVTTINTTSLNTWYHVVVTYNGNEEPTGINIYLNSGIQALTTVADNDITSYDMTTTLPFQIGEYAISYKFTGKIDECVLYDKELNQTDINYRYNSGAGTELFETLPPESACVIGTPTPYANNSVNVDTDAEHYWTVPTSQPEGHLYYWSCTVKSMGGATMDSAVEPSTYNESAQSYINHLVTLACGTQYKVEVRTKTLIDLVWNNATFYFTTEYEQPVFSSESPTNTSTCEPFSSDFSVDIDSPNGTGMNVNITTTEISMPFLDQTYNSTTAQYVSLAGTQWYSQGFTMAYSGWISQIKLYMKRVGVGIGNCNVYLYNTMSGKPTTLVDTADPVDGDTIGTSSYQWVTFTFSTPVYKLATQQLHIVVSLPSSGVGDFIYWSSIGSNAYIGGNLAGSGDSGSTWTVYANNDGSFKQYYLTHTLITTSWSSYSGTNGTYTNVISPLNIGYNYTTVVSAHSQYSDYTNASYWFTASDNTAPYYSALTIANGSTGVTTSPTWSLTLDDDESTFDYNISCNGDYVEVISSLGGIKSLPMTGLLWGHVYTVYVNVTDYGGSSCPPISMNWYFTFTTVDADSPLVTFLYPLVSPVTISNPDHMYINVTFNMTDPNGLPMDYTIECDNGDSGVDWGVSNGTYYLNLTTAITLGTTYTIWVNVTNGFNASNVSTFFTTRTNTGIVFGTPSPANNSVGVTIGGGWSIPFTDADSPTYTDTVNISIEMSSGHSYLANLTAPNTGLCIYSGLSYTTNYTVWVNTTDEWGGVVTGIYYFRTAPFTMGGTPYLVYNTNQTFSFIDSNGSALDFSTLGFADWLYNSTDITGMDYYLHDGDLTINFTTLMVYEPFTIDFLNDATLVYQDYSNSLLCGDHVTHTLTLIKRVASVFYENVLNRTWNSPDWIGLKTDHKEYYIGQNIIFSYYIPDEDFSDGYSLVMHKHPNWVSGGGFWGTQSIFDNNVWKVPDVGLTLDYGQWITMILDSSTFTGGYPSVDTEYRINLGKDNAYWWFWNDIPTANGLTFKLLNVPLTPTGTFGSPSPVSPDVGTTVTFPFSGINNYGRVVFDDLFSQSEPPFVAFNILDSAVTYEFDLPSVYRVDLQVWNGDDEFITVDTISSFYVNSTTGNDTFGWQVEYLDPERKMIVVGLHPLEFAYSTLKAGTTDIVIRNPDGDTTRYSTQISSPARGIYSHMLASNVPIGIWNVTMYGNETFYFEFTVVADEHNYIDFVKLEYGVGDQFQVYVVHNTNSIIKFYKWDEIKKLYVGKGAKTYLDVTIPNGLITIEHDVVAPESGDWRVELWECDNRIEIRKLASYDCTVTVTASSVVIPTGGSILPSIDPTIGFIVGLIITLFCLLIPFIISKALNTASNPPALVFAFTGGLGISVSVILGFFPAWVIPFIAVIGVVIVMVLYFMNKRGGGEGI